MNVFILTEGGKDAGLGHITRCTSIYQAFEEVGIRPALIVNGDEAVQDLLKDKNFRLFDWLNNQQLLFKTLNNAQIVFIDSYLADFNLYEKISNLIETCVYFDDDIRIDYPKGFVVNGAIFAEQMPYPKREDVTYLLGVQYTPLRKEFWDVPAKPIRDNLETVMVTFGGTDIYNLTPKVLKLLAGACPELFKKVIIGSGFQNIAEIEKVKDRNTELIYYPNAAEMKKAMLESDVAISAGGQTLYELARVGVPTIGICVAQNQSQNISEWRKSGVLEYVGWHSDENLSEKIIDALNKFVPYNERIKRSAIVRNYVDGQGVRIMVNCISNTVVFHS